MTRSNRRTFLKAAAAAAAFGLVDAERTQAASSGQKFGPPRPFSFDLLKEAVRKMAKEPYVGPARPAPEIVAKINYDAWSEIKFDMDHALFADGPGRFPVSFFHLGMFFHKAVEMNVVEAGQAREIIYDPSYFDMPEDLPARHLPKGAGFAGFRVQEARDGALDWRKNDWVAFLGADYFRAIGELRQYGLSCRAVALDVAVRRQAAKNFPISRNSISTNRDRRDGLTLYALLEGPSIVGACSFAMTRGKGVVMDIEQTLCLRRDIARFGIAPLTSMYWFSETNKPTAIDWRPEVHDSDGLAHVDGQRRASLAAAQQSAAHHGFGFHRQQSARLRPDAARPQLRPLSGWRLYDRRPSLWVEPKGHWGKGAIQLVEIPTDDEIHDNIVAMWVPERSRGGRRRRSTLAYRLYWLADEPFPTRSRALRRDAARQWRPARPAAARRACANSWSNSSAPPLASLPFGVKPEPVLWASRGTFSYIFTEAVPDDVPGHWRAQFDLTVTGDGAGRNAALSSLRRQDLSETWMFQYHPWSQCKPSCFPNPGT